MLVGLLKQSTEIVTLKIIIYTAFNIYLVEIHAQ